MTDYSYQLYSSRNFGPLPETLHMLAELGYKQVEGYDALYADRGKADDLIRHLDASGLAMPTGHFGLGMLEASPDRALDIARALGVARIYAPFLPPDQRPASGAGYEAFGRRLDEVGKRVRDAGLGFGWHNHAFEFEPLADGAVPQAVILEAAPELEWEADIAWVIKGGADPFEWIDRFADRVTAVHVKDIAPEGRSLDEDGWADLGAGVVPWDRLMHALRATPARHFVMEHDNPSDDRRFAAASIGAARSFQQGANQ